MVNSVPTCPGILCRSAAKAVRCTALLTVCLLGLSAISVAGAQVPATKPDKASPARHVRSHHPAKSKAKPEPEKPATPPQPKWPINDSPSPAKIDWNSTGLQIAASNSSLRQILNQVGTLTGAKVQGMGADERVFGNYGPGPADDVLSHLLHGTGYNVLMLGDQGAGTPREVILTARTSGGSTPVHPVAVPQPQDQPDEDIEPDQEEAPSAIMPAPPLQEAPTPGNGPITPQQLEELQRQRMQQMQQQQMQIEEPQQPPQDAPQSPQ